MADHPLRPATDHRLGRPLPHQQANPTRAPPLAINLSRMPLSRHPAYAVLAEVSLGYPPLMGRFPRATHPCATPPGAETPRSVRLACVKHAASVRSEPGSNSHVQSRQTRHPQGQPLSEGRPVVTGPGPAQSPDPIKGHQTLMTECTRIRMAHHADANRIPSARPTAQEPPPAHPFFTQQCQSATRSAKPPQVHSPKGPAIAGGRLYGPPPITVKPLLKRLAILLAALAADCSGPVG